MTQHCEVSAVAAVVASAHQVARVARVAIRVAREWPECSPEWPPSDCSSVANLGHLIGLLAATLGLKIYIHDHL